jgi:ATP-dependent DNA helicase RecG
MNEFNAQPLINTLLGLIAKGRECEWIEFKENNSNPELIGEYLSALSNSAFLLDEPYGYLVYGVRDSNLEVVGTSFDFYQAKKGNEPLENWLSRSLDPRIDFQPNQFDIEGKRVILIRIDATRMKPVSFMGNEFIRVGSTTKKLKEHPEKERKIWEKTSQAAFENLIAMSDLQEDQVLGYLDYSKYFDLIGLPLPEGREGILKRLLEEKLVKRNDNLTWDITNLGAILFAKNLQRFETLKRKATRVIIYKGTNRLETIKEQEGVLGYAAGFQGLIDYINDHLPTNEVIGSALRQTVKVYPELAIRELVANMLIHQDFSINGTGPVVEIFEDRIEISNPGKPLVETLRLIDHSPVSRNEHLAYFMRRINVCEERGSGIDKVVGMAEAYQLPAPKFVREDSYFKAILYSPKELKDMNKEDRIRACYQHCCLKYVSNQFMTNESLRSRFKIKDSNYPQASRIIADALASELIKLSDPTSRSKKNASYIPFWA